MQDFSVYAEKRIFKRIPKTLMVIVSYGSCDLIAKSSNLSCGGLLIQSSDPLAFEDLEDDTVDLSLFLPQRLQPLVIPAEVIRFYRGKLAVRFTGLYNDNILELERYIKSCHEQDIEMSLSA